MQISGPTSIIGGQDVFFIFADVDIAGGYLFSVFAVAEVDPDVKNNADADIRSTYIRGGPEVDSWMRI